MATFVLHWHIVFDNTISQIKAISYFHPGHPLPNKFSNSSLGALEQPFNTNLDIIFVDFFRCKCMFWILKAIQKIDDKVPSKKVIDWK